MQRNRKCRNLAHQQMTRRGRSLHVHVHISIVLSRMRSSLRFAAWFPNAFSPRAFVFYTFQVLQSILGLAQAPRSRCFNSTIKGLTLSIFFPYSCFNRYCPVLSCLVFPCPISHLCLLAVVNDLLLEPITKRPGNLHVKRPRFIFFPLD